MESIFISRNHSPNTVRSIKLVIIMSYWNNNDSMFQFNKSKSSFSFKFDMNFNRECFSQMHLFSQIGVVIMVYLISVMQDIHQFNNKFILAPSWSHIFKKFNVNLNSIIKLEYFNEIFNFLPYHICCNTGSHTAHVLDSLALSI